jgi:hypothetical protein
MRFALALLWMGFLVFASGGCGIYTPYGAQTSGARTFSVDYYRPQSPLASPAVAQNFTESLKQRRLAIQIGISIVFYSWHSYADLKRKISYQLLHFLYPSSVAINSLAKTAFSNVDRR